MAVDRGLVEARRVAARRLLRAARALDLELGGREPRFGGDVLVPAREEKPAATSTTAAATGHHVRRA